MNTAVLRTEVDKLRSLASTWWLLGIMAVVSLALSGFGVRETAEGQEPGIADVLTGPAFAQLLIMVFAARSATMEFRTGTIWASRLAVPSWPRLLTGKAAVVAGLAARAGTVLVAGGLAVAAPAEPAAHLTPSSGLDWRQLLTVPAAFAITAVMGLAIGLLLKSGGATVAVMLVWVLVGEPALGAAGEWLLSIDLGAWLPFVALSDFQGQPGGTPFPGGPYGAGLYVAAPTAGLLAAAIRMQDRREP
jgi:ABC-2 type transport system permease protein